MIEVHTIQDMEVSAVYTEILVATIVTEMVEWIGSLTAIEIVIIVLTVNAVNEMITITHITTNSRCIILAVVENLLAILVITALPQVEVRDYLSLRPTHLFQPPHLRWDQ
jgi:hypothetical protein